MGLKALFLPEESPATDFIALKNPLSSVSVQWQAF
jgi:hypothetical protein